MTRKFCLVLFFVGILTAAASAQQDREPTLISAPRPVYPKEAKDALIGGRISTQITISETGEVVSIGDIVGPAPLCDSGSGDSRLAALRASVREALKEAKFSPAIKDGNPTRATIWVGSTFDPFEDFKTGKKRIINSGVINGKALRLVKPEYPPAARAVRASGAVSIAVVVDERGKVFSADAVSGHPLLRSSAVRAACSSKFSPTTLEGNPIRIAGVITYVFAP